VGSWLLPCQGTRPQRKLADTITIVVVDAIPPPIAQRAPRVMLPPGDASARGRRSQAILDPCPRGPFPEQKSRAISRPVFSVAAGGPLWKVSPACGWGVTPVSNFPTTSARPSIESRMDRVSTAWRGKPILSAGQYRGYGDLYRNVT